MSEPFEHARAVFAKAAASLSIILLCGCGIIDHFGPRATHYNDETADAKSAAILLNILRAAYSNPLQFTDVSTVSGQSTANGSLGASSGSFFPIPLNGLASNQQRMANISPNVTAGTSLNANTTFNIANLNTQEFYRGIQTPLKMQQIAYYLSGQFNGLNPSQLLPLFISDIELYSGKIRYTLHGSAHNPDTFFAFVSAINTLIENGLTVEPVNTTDTVGPSLTAAEVKDPRIVAAVLGSSGTSGINLAKVNNEYQLKTEKGGYRFCFSRVRYPYRYVHFSVSTPPRDPLVIALGYENGRPIKQTTIAIGGAYYCGSKAARSSSIHNQLQVAGLGIRLTTRSLEQIIFFLGEMVRTELGLGTGVGNSLALEYGAGQSPFNLFSIEPRRPDPGEMSVKYNGQPFTIRVDPSGRLDTSSRIIQLLTDLWALQSSAKDLPAPNVITVTAP
ncbi:hypothetical protein [Methyloceanibacter sp.]|uniref:hypothetical protein n=1 Tax=Methyloceanibacter sp. TaxID=1965321 RepID=UPI003D6C8B5F